MKRTQPVVTEKKVGTSGRINNKSITLESLNYQICEPKVKIKDFSTQLYSASVKILIEILTEVACSYGKDEFEYRDINFARTF